MERGSAGKGLLMGCSADQLPCMGSKAKGLQRLPWA